MGKRNSCSWSMRSWLFLKLTGVHFEERTLAAGADGIRASVRAKGGESGLIPVLYDEDAAIWDTLAIAETLAELHTGLWPRCARARARARSLSGEMHAGFTALRRDLPFNVRARQLKYSISAELADDLRRIDEIFCSAAGSWLCGDYSIVDAMFAPVALRALTYEVKLSDAAQTYADRLLTHSDVLLWRESAEREEKPGSSAPLT